MSSQASSPSSTPSRPSLSSHLSAHCISDLSTITNQLLDKDAAIRFRCLASFRYGRSEVLNRCVESCETQARPNVFDRAKQILQRNLSVTLEDFVNVIVRILFCKKHGEATSFKKYCAVLQANWNGDALQELQLLEAIRSAYQLPVVGALAASLNTVRLPSPFLDEPSGLESKLRSTSLSDNPEIEISITPTPTNTEGVVDISEAQGQPLNVVDTGLSGKKHLVPIPPSRRFRSRSNPPQPNENIFTQSSNFETTCVTTQDTMPSHTKSSLFGSPSKTTFNFSRSAPIIELQLRLSKNEMLRQYTTAPESSSANHRAGISVPVVPSLCEAIPHVAPKTESTNLPPNGSKQGVFDWSKFTPSDWVSHDPFWSLAPSGGRRTHFQPTTMPKSSKDDTFIEKLANSVANTAPPLFETTIQHKTPPPTLNNTSGKKSATYMPVVADGWIRDAIKKPVTKEGSIYVLKAPQYFEQRSPGQQPLVKIGISVNVNTRIAQLKKSCGMFDLERIDDREDFPHPWYYKVEELAHSELANFQQVLNCEKCKTAHREWFAVPEEVALRTVQRWRRFILEDPYDEIGLLKDQWSQMLRPANMMWPGREEEPDDHEKRNDRWDRWLAEGIKSTRLLK